MSRSLSGYWERVRSELESAFAEKHTPHEVAGSFAIGVFVTTLPSAGLGLVFFLVLVRLSDRISSIAIFSSAIMINPLVKAPMFIAAFWIGTRLLGPTGTATGGNIVDTTGIAVRMIAGFIILGVAIAAIGYVGVYLLMTEYRKRDIAIVEEVIDDELLAE